MSHGTNDFLDVEIFLIANDRLPSEKGDAITRDMVMKVIDLAHKGNKKAEVVLNYAFHRLGLMSCKGGDDCPSKEDHK